MSFWSEQIDELKDTIKALRKELFLSQQKELDTARDLKISQEVQKRSLDFRKMYYDVMATSEKQNQEVEQLRTQLAGCSVAALGGTYQIAHKGDYGWSPAYQDVLELRYKADKLQEEYKREHKWLNDAAEEIGCDLDQVGNFLHKIKALVKDAMDSAPPSQEKSRTTEPAGDSTFYRDAVIGVDYGTDGVMINNRWHQL